MSEKKVLGVIRVENFLKYIRKKRVWVEFRPGDKEKAYEMIFDNTSVFVSENPELYGH